MNPTQQLHDLGQSLWLDNITRGLLTSERLAATSTNFRSLASRLILRSSTMQSRTQPLMMAPSARRQRKTWQARTSSLS